MLIARGGDLAVGVESRRTATHQDLTTGNLPRQIARLSVPGTADRMLAFGVVGLLHAYWMGQVGGAALAAVSMATTLRIVIISPMMGLSGGGMAVVARYVGAHDNRTADRATMQTILLIVFFTLPLTAIGLVLGETFLRWMGAEGELLSDALAYLRVIFSGLLFMEMLPSMNGVLRGAGHPEYILRITIVNLVVMGLLEPVLVLGLGPFPALGVRGAAWAAVISSAAGVAAQFATLASGRAGLRLHVRDLRPDGSLMRRVLKVAIPTSVQRFSPNLANALLMRLVSGFGTDVLTAYSVTSRVSGFLQCPAMGLGSAAATLMGQNLGARKPHRAQRATELATGGALAITLTLLALLNLWPWLILRPFDSSAAVLAIGVTATRYFLFSGVGLAWMTVLGLALNGAGDTVSTMAVSIGALWLVQLPLSWALSIGMRMGPTGIWLGLAAGNLLGGLAMMRRFKQGLWKRIEL